MKKLVAMLSFAAAIAAPIASPAATVDATLIPDGTYVVKVERVQDAQHVVVIMQNGMETTLTARNATDFNRVKANDTLKISLIKGIVPVFAVQ